MRSDGWIARVIDASLARPRRVLALAVLTTVVAFGWAWQLKLDALPDLSEPQVIVKVDDPGQPPQRIEDEVTFPLTSALLGVPGASAVRAWSMFGEAFVYVVLDPAADAARARAAVVERLARLQATLPAGARAEIGPEASGTGWVYQYAVVSRGTPVAAERLRAVQDFQLRPALQAVPGVAEVATFGGEARQLQVTLRTREMTALGLDASAVANALREGNRAAGGGAFEAGRHRYVIATDSRLRGVEDLPDLPVGTDANGAVIRLRQVADLGFGPGPREGVSDLDGRGDVTSGVVVMRQGENAARVVDAVKARIEALRGALPAGVEVVPTYDRSDLIGRAVRSLAHRLVEEAAVVAVVCGVFLWRLRSAGVAIAVVPIGVLVALALLERQGITANIMSLGGIAIAIGAMIDASVVMVETLHRRLERPDASTRSHAALVRESAREVGPALFRSLLVITVSFLPVFSLQGQEGKLFAPLALTKTYAMAAAAVSSITVVPVLMGLLVRGPVQREMRNPLNRALRRVYRPVLAMALARPRRVVSGAVLVICSAAWPLARLGTEFMPSLDEGDLLYMPTTLPSVSVDEAADILRRTDSLIRREPEVASVHGKAGRSDSATDPAPLAMLESTVRLKPRAEWPDPSLSVDRLVDRLEADVRMPGMVGAWGHPIRTRIDMLSTGVKTALALRVTAPDRGVVRQRCEAAEAALRRVPGVRSAFAERPDEGRVVDVAFDRGRGSALGVRAGDVAGLLEGPVAGAPVDTLAIGRERYPIVVRLPRDERDSPEALGRLRVPTLGGSSVALDQVATTSVRDGPMEIRTEDGVPVGYVMLDLDDPDVGRVLALARRAVEAAGLDAPGASVEFVGQYLRLRNATARLWLISAATLLAVVLLLQWHFRSWGRVALVLAGLPVALAGALWLCLAMGLRWSFATTVGTLALAGVTAEFCVVMLLYLDQQVRAGAIGAGPRAVSRAVMRGALLRLRPKAMTVSVILGSLAPLLFVDGVGVEVMRRVAAPLVGGMLTAPLYSLLVVPAVYQRLLARSPEAIA